MEENKICTAVYLNQNMEPLKEFPANSFEELFTNLYHDSICNVAYLGLMLTNDKSVLLDIQDILYGKTIEYPNYIIQDFWISLVELCREEIEKYDDILEKDFMTKRMFEIYLLPFLYQVIEGHIPTIFFTGKATRLLLSEPSDESFQNIMQYGLHDVSWYHKNEKISANAPCPCGSHKKYKKCHGRMS